MSPPILALSNTKSAAPKATPNLLPCRVQHNGSIEPVQSFWEPRKQEDGTKTAYFRGRKLHGTTLTLPEGYRGVVAAPIAPPEKDDDVNELVIDLEDENRGKPPQGSLDVQAEFDEVVVWGHETAVDATGDDPYVRGMGEWLRLADQIHSYPKPDKK